MQESEEITLCLPGIPMAALDDATQWRVLFKFSQELLSIVAGEHGLKCVATRDIAARQVILVEPPVATFDINPMGQGAQFMARPDVQALQQTIMRCFAANAGREGTDAFEKSMVQRIRGSRAIDAFASDQLGDRTSLLVKDCPNHSAR